MWSIRSALWRKVPSPARSTDTPHSGAPSRWAMYISNAYSISLKPRVSFPTASYCFGVSMSINDFTQFHDRTLHHKIRPGCEPEGAGEGFARIRRYIRAGSRPQEDEGADRV